MRCAQYKGSEEPLVRDQDVPLLKKGARGRSAVERERRKEGHHKGLWHMVIVKPLWRALQEHTVAPEAMAHRLLRRMVEHLQERMACRETQLEARAEDMRDPVTKQVEMALIRYNPKITEIEVRRRPDWRPRRCNRCIVVDLSCNCEACSLDAPGVVTPDTSPDISEPT